MSRIIEMLVYGMIACAQLAAAVILLDHFTRAAAPKHAAQAALQVQPPGQPPAAALMPVAPPAASAERLPPTRTQKPTSRRPTNSL
ncbi:hypothetical protein [Nevskia soli]|uniref:hypothetical protein n=1 Tax=Nevskia soli TaxID=418856 RepID=UPI0004A76947|nr:hypothetical protein [Nevskia soli]